MTICISEPVLTQCCVANLCFECVLTLPDFDDLKFNIIFGNYLVVLTLFLVGIWNVISFYKSYKLNLKYNYMPIMRLNNFVYAIGTGLFGLTRLYYQLGKPLLILAAIHNLCEWVFVGFAFYKLGKHREYSHFGSFCFIFIIIGSMIQLLAEFQFYALSEQITGIGLDFMLPIVWFILYLQNKNKKVKTNEVEIKIQKSNMYLVAFIAHFIHLFFTILPLVILNFVRNQNETLNRILEFILFLSVPITHILYTKFTTLHETYVDLPSYIKDTHKGTYSDDDIVEAPRFAYITTPFRRVAFWYILAVIIGLFPTIIIPKVIMKINDDKFCDFGDFGDISDNFIIGTTRAMVHDNMQKSFEYYVNSKNLIKNARNFEDNIFFYFTKSLYNPNEYFFVEGWKSVDAAKKWINSSYDRNVMNDYLLSMVENKKLEVSGYQPFKVNNINDNIGYGAIRNVFTLWNNGCDDLWNEMIDISNCKWLAGIDHCVIQNDIERMQYYSNGMDPIHIKWNYKPYKYEYIDPLDENNIIKIYNYSYQTTKFERSSDMILTYNKNKYGNDACHVMYTFDTNVDLGDVDGVYYHFYVRVVPFLQQTYQTITDVLKKTNGTNRTKHEICNI